MIDFLQASFNNRELATFVWLTVLFIYLMFSKTIRHSLWNVIKSIFDRKIITIILLTLIYVTGVFFLLNWIGFWELSMLKQSIYWFFGTALVVLFNVNNAAENKNFFKDLIIDNLKFIVIIEFLVTLHHFSFIGEIFFLPIITIIAVIHTYSEGKEKYKPTYRVFSILLALITLILITFSLIDFFKSIYNYANVETLKSFGFPIILGGCYIPFVYMIAVLFEYETLFIRFQIFIKDSNLLCYARRRSIKYYKLNFRKIHSETQRIMREFYSGITKEEIKSIFNNNS